ncbi:MAG: RNA 3'-phosphate cyclase [Anderseniella sp.]|nr:RNA 3'-phosphate cyclase [Anderseniella sp.]
MARHYSASERRAKRLIIDGSHGEGGGQILRSALSLAAITERPVRLENIRARRRRPGLATQHLTAVRAVAAICAAQLVGDELHSENLEFTPGEPVKSGHYVFDVAAARKGGSAGSAPLVLQAVLIPLALADGPSQVDIHGGTHVPWSPPFDYLQDVWLPTLAMIGVTTDIELRRWGWFPAGGGLVRCSISGSTHPLKPFRLVDKGPLQIVSGRSVAAHLPDHISNRMAERAKALLDEAGIPSALNADVVESKNSGAGIFLTAQYAHVRGGFCAHGKRGKQAEDVAAEAVEQLLAHKTSSAALEHHLADQLILPLAFANGTSQFSVDRITGHLETHAWLVEQFGLASVKIEEREDGTGHVRIFPQEIGS